MLSPYFIFRYMRMILWKIPSGRDTPFLFCKVVCLYVSIRVNFLMKVCPFKIPQIVSETGSFVSTPSI